MIFWSQGARELDMQGMDRTDLCRIGFNQICRCRAKMDFVKRVEMDLVETHLEQLRRGLFCAAGGRD